MFTLAEFSQGQQLSMQPTDEITRRGICVALCDDWLALIKNSYALTPEQRMKQLEVSFRASMAQQRAYSGLRKTHGREEGRRRAGSKRGLAYEFDKTQVFRIVAGGVIERSLPEFWGTVGRDISRVNSAATWTLRFEDGGGHAIAGYCGGEVIAVGFQLKLHIFDPNLGEYFGDYDGLNEIFSHMRASIPMYLKVDSIHRATELS